MDDDVRENALEDQLIVVQGGSVSPIKTIHRRRGRVQPCDSICLNVHTGKITAKARPNPRDVVIGRVVSVENRLVGVALKPGIEWSNE